MTVVLGEMFYLNGSDSCESTCLQRFIPSTFPTCLRTFVPSPPSLCPAPAVIIQRMSYSRSWDSHLGSGWETRPDLDREWCDPSVTPRPGDDPPPVAHGAGRMGRWRSVIWGLLMYAFGLNWHGGYKHLPNLCVLRVRLSHVCVTW